MEILTPEIDKIPLKKWLKLDFITNSLSAEYDLLIENNIWVTAYKRKIPVKNMSTTHIKNCINCFNGTGNSNIPNDYLGGKEKWLKIFNHELSIRN